MAKRKPKTPAPREPKKRPPAKPRRKPAAAPKPKKPPVARGRKPPTPAPPADALTLAEEAFLREYLLTFSRTAAYQRAFPGCAYSTARSEGSKLLTKPNIRRELRAYQAEQRRRFRVAAAAVLRKRAELAFSDIGDVVEFDHGVPVLKDRAAIPIEARRAIKSVAVTQYGVKVTMHDQPASLRALELHLGLATTEIPGLEAFLTVLPADLAAAVRTRLEAGRG